MKTKKRFTDKFYLSNTGGECEIVAASGHPIFGQFEADDWTAYATVHFGKSLPMVVGPESINGAIFGMHPAVIERSYRSMIHKQVNMGHNLKSLGKKEDRICGCVLQVAFPPMPEGGWVIPDRIEDAPEITAFSALHKQAQGVPKMLGDHLGGKVKMSVSMEFTYYLDEVGIYDPSTKMTYDRKDIPASLKAMTYEDEKGRLGVRKSSRNPALVLALGGLSGRIWFTGYGYTDRPAESTAGIDAIAASQRQGLMVCGAVADVPHFAPGTPVAWKGGEWGRGVVMACHWEGAFSRHGITLNASEESPILDIRLPDGVRIFRRAASVSKKI